MTQRDPNGPDSNGPDSSPSRLTAECRAFLRAGMPDANAVDGGADAQHSSTCSFCSARLAAKQRLAAGLRVAPVVPPEVHSVAFLDGIRTRIIEQSERSGIGAWLEKGMPVPALPELEDAFPAGLLESELAQAAVRGVSPSRERGVLIDPDAASAWPRVRARVLADLGERAGREQVPHRFFRGKGAALASVAAAAIICAMLVSEGTPPPPAIVITDMAAMPSVEFSPMAVLRHGANR
jgi:hypothetical protein